MSELRYPLKDHLEDPAHEAALARVWRAIDAGAPVRRRSTRLIPAMIIAGAGALGLLIGLRVHEPGPLRLADGRPIVGVAAPADGAVLALADGSRIQLGAGAELDPLESTGSSFAAAVRRGSAHFEVRPGGPRRWQIECGLATVEVVGTGFSCERLPGRLRVSVQHGVVLVRGERVPDRARRLAAGESLDVFEGVAPPVTPAPHEAASGPPAPAANEPVTTLIEARAPRGPKVAWRELARAGRNGEAYATLGARGLTEETRRAGVGDLLALADVARLSGHPAGAVTPLERILRDFPTDAQAPLAAFALGRLQLDALEQPANAAKTFARALDLGLPQSLREDARARLVEAEARAGDLAGARRAADAYTREFPGGRYTQSIRSRLP